MGPPTGPLPVPSGPQPGIPRPQAPYWSGSVQPCLWETHCPPRSPWVSSLRVRQPIRPASTQPSPLSTPSPARPPGQSSSATWRPAAHTTASRPPGPRWPHVLLASWDWATLPTAGRGEAGVLAGERPVRAVCWSSSLVLKELEHQELVPKGRQQNKHARRNESRRGGASTAPRPPTVRRPHPRRAAPPGALSKGHYDVLERNW